MPSTDLIQLPPMTRKQAEARADRFEAMAEGAAGVANQQELENGLQADIDALRDAASDLRNALHGEAGEGADLAAAAQNAVAAIDSMFDFFLRSGLVEEGGGLALYEEGKTLADARVKLAEALGGEAS